MIKLKNFSDKTSYWLQYRVCFMHMAESLGFVSLPASSRLEIPAVIREMHAFVRTKMVDTKKFVASNEEKIPEQIMPRHKRKTWGKRLASSQKIQNCKENINQRTITEASWNVTTSKESPATCWNATTPVKAMYRYKNVRHFSANTNKKDQCYTLAM